MLALVNVASSLAPGKRGSAPREGSSWCDFDCGIFTLTAQAATLKLESRDNLTFDLRYLERSPTNDFTGRIGLSVGVSSLGWITPTCSWTPTEVENTEKLGASKIYVLMLSLSLDLLGNNLSQQVI